MIGICTKNIVKNHEVDENDNLKHQHFNDIDYFH